MSKLVTTVLQNLVPPRHIDDCCVIHFLRHCLLADIAIGVLRKVRADTMLTHPNPVPLLLANPFLNGFFA